MTTFFHGLQLPTLAEYEWVEATLTLRPTSPKPEAQGPAARNFKPNLLVRMAKVPTDTHIDTISKEVRADIEKTAGSMVSGLDECEFLFRDQVRGRLLSFAFTFRAATLRQLQALRLDGDTLTHLTYTSNASQWDEAQEQNARHLLSQTSALPASPNK